MQVRIASTFSEGFVKVHKVMLVRHSNSLPEAEGGILCILDIVFPLRVHWIFLNYLEDGGACCLILGLRTAEHVVGFQQLLRCNCAYILIPPGSHGVRDHFGKLCFAQNHRGEVSAGVAGQRKRRHLSQVCPPQGRERRDAVAG